MTILFTSMRKKIVQTSCALAMLTGIAIAGAGSADAAKYRNLNLGAWKGGIYTNDTTGEFSHCVVSAKYKSGITLLFSVTKGLKWQIGFSKPGWKLTVGKSYPILYQVDKHRTNKGKANAATTRLVVIPLPGSSTLFQQMRRGRKLRVKAGEDILTFNLTGTSKMLTRLLDCAKRYEDLVVSPSASRPKRDSENPFETAEQPKPKPRAQSSGIAPQYRDEARTWFNSHLAVAGDQYSVIPNEGNAQKMYRKHAIIWRVGKKTGIVGSLRIFPTKKTEALENNVLAFEARTCKGDFASKYFTHDGVGSAPASRLLATCRLKTGKTWSTYYTITNRQEAGSYLITLLSSSASSDAVVDAGERLTGLIQTGAGPRPVEQPVVDDLPIREDDGADTKEF